jgi:hypothetical protein
VVAYVPGSKAGSYKFTSALAVQIFKDLIPQIKPLLVAPQPQPATPPQLLVRYERPNADSSIQR